MINTQFFSRTFFRGLLVLLPLILTIYPLYYFFHWLNSISNELIQYFFPRMTSIPGMGIILGIITIFLLGLLLSSGFVRRLYDWIESPLLRIPLVKSIYSAIKELTRYLAPDPGRKTADKVVVVRMPDTGIEIIGFIMRNDLTPLPDEVEKQDRVAVYFPMSYQVGGYTLFLPRSWLKNTDMSVEDAMKNVLTGWVSNR
jgi:uncharacterized membrane protein